MSGLFSTFNVATRGMQVQQKAIDVTSHNIANANTEGFSRQRVSIEATTPYEMPTFSSSTEAGQLGTGAQVSSIERYRDSFLDYQTRVETSTNGKYEMKSNILSNIEGIFNEPSDTGLSATMGKFFDAWQQLSKQPQSSNTRTVVAQQSATLADDLNHTYDQLMTLKESVNSQIKESVSSVNMVLNQLDKLNQQIIRVSTSGYEPNDLMDKRDLLLDQLSSKFNFNIEKTQNNGINLRPTDSNGITGSYMIKAEKDQDLRSLSYISSIDKDSADPSGATYIVTYYKHGDIQSEQNKGIVKVNISDPQILKDMKNSGILLANNDGTAITKDGKVIDENTIIDSRQLSVFQPSDGEINGLNEVQNDIDSYIDQLNNLAKVLAFSVNAVHSGMSDGQAVSPVLDQSGNPVYDTNGKPVMTPSKDGVPFFVNSSTVKYNTDGTVSNINEVLSAEQNITAGNISVNKEIMTDVMKIKTRTHDDEFLNAADNNIDGETDGTRALAIAKLRDSLLNISDIGNKVFNRSDMLNSENLKNNGMDITNNVNGTAIDSYFKDAIDKLGIQSQGASRMVTNQQVLLENFKQSRESVSGVSLDEEMTNLVQFQHAYQANAKVISTVDQLLDVVINGLKK